MNLKKIFLLLLIPTAVLGKIGEEPSEVVEEKQVVVEKEKPSGQKVEVIKEIKTIEQIKEGNFAVNASQTIGPFISFGQLIIPKKSLILLTFLISLVGHHKRDVGGLFTLLYGITDKFSVYVGLPVGGKKNDCFKSSGVGDLFVQFEHIIHSKQNDTYGTQVTAVANITLPTGSTDKNPATGLGSPSFLLGVTASYLAYDWYFFTSQGGIITTEHHRTKFGSAYLYEFGLGKNIIYKKDAWIFDWLVEFDGTFAKRDKIDGVIDPNSGGNSILITPTLYFATNHLTVTGGVGFFPSQHLNGQQNKNKCAPVLGLYYTF